MEGALDLISFGMRLCFDAALVETLFSLDGSIDKFVAEPEWKVAF